MALLRRILAGSAAAAAASTPEEVEAGILNVASKALRESSDLAKRTEADERGIGRGERKTQKVAQLNPQEKAAIRSSIAGTKIKAIDAFNLARDFKKRHPVSVEAKYKIHILEELIGSGSINENEVEQFFDYLDYDEAVGVRYYLHTMKPKNPYPLHLRTKQREVELTEAAIIEKRSTKATKSSAVIVNPTGCPTITDILPDYMRSKKWDLSGIRPGSTLQTI